MRMQVMSLRAALRAARRADGHRASDGFLGHLPTHHVSPPPAVGARVLSRPWQNSTGQALPACSVGGERRRRFSSSDTLACGPSTSVSRTVPQDTTAVLDVWAGGADPWSLALLGKPPGRSKCNGKGGSRSDVPHDPLANAAPEAIVAELRRSYGPNLACSSTDNADLEDIPALGASASSLCPPASHVPLQPDECLEAVKCIRAMHRRCAAVLQFRQATCGALLCFTCSCLMSDLLLSPWEWWHPDSGAPCPPHASIHSGCYRCGGRGNGMYHYCGYARPPARNVMDEEAMFAAERRSEHRRAALSPQAFRLCLAASHPWAVALNAGICQMQRRWRECRRHRAHVDRGDNALDAVTCSEDQAELSFSERVASGDDEDALGENPGDIHDSAEGALLCVSLRVGGACPVAVELPYVATVHDLKVVALEYCSVPLSDLRILLRGRLLRDDMPLSDCNVCDDDVFVVARASR